MNKQKENKEMRRWIKGWIKFVNSWYRTRRTIKIYETKERI